MQKHLYVLLSIAMLSLTATDLNKCSVNNKRPQYSFISMPCSGSYQLMRCILLLESSKETTNVQENWPNRVGNTQHLIFNKKNSDFLLKNQTKIIVNIRHPYDRLISYAKVWKDRKKDPRSLSKIAYQLIDKSYGYYFPLEKNSKDLDNYKAINFCEQYDYYMPWIRDPQWLHNTNLLIIRFENLVGPKGGGNLETQVAEIKKIARFLEIPLSEKRLAFIIENLWGNTFSFKKNKKVKQWKNYFTQEHYLKLKETGVDLIVSELGYPINI